MIRTESGFDPKAESHKGAKGLMQITDQTGLWGAQEIGIKDYHSQRLFEPDINIQIGAWYVRRLLNQYKGDLTLTLAAYNGGSGNVARWLGDSRYSEDGKTLNHIPFKETKQYVKKVRKNLKQYQKFYEKK
jgi:soluble lytic murein transglycosylase